MFLINLFTQKAVRELFHLLVPFPNVQAEVRNLEFTSCLPGGRQDLESPGMLLGPTVGWKQMSWTLKSQHSDLGCHILTTAPQGLLLHRLPDIAPSLTRHRLYEVVLSPFMAAVGMSVCLHRFRLKQRTLRGAWKKELIHLLSMHRS